MFLHVNVQTRLLNKGLITKLTLDWFFPGVPVAVVGHVVFAVEALTAEVTLVLADIGMDGGVAVQLRLTVEELRTLVAWGDFCTELNSFLVSLKIPILCEAAVATDAAAELVKMTLFPVCLQLTHTGGFIPADLATMLPGHGG